MEDMVNVKSCDYVGYFIIGLISKTDSLTAVAVILVHCKLTLLNLFFQSKYRDINSLVNGESFTAVAVIHVHHEFSLSLSLSLS